MTRPSLPAAELRRFTHSPRALLALVAVVLVPLVYGALYTWANQSPQTRVDQVTAAVVNLDEPVTLTKADGSSQLVPLGRSVVGKLTGADSSANFHWVLTDAPAAAAGLADGRYAAVLTIPADFSRAATSTGGDPADARAARIAVQTNDAVNYLDGSIAKAIATATSAETARTITEGYLQALYAGYGTLRSSLGDAATGADKLADGAGKLASGAEEAADGAGSLADGVGQLATGATSAAAGARKLAGGADQAAAGAGRLAEGLATLDSRTSGLPAQTGALADGASQVSSGLAGLAPGAAALATGAGQLQTGVTAYTQGVEGLAATCAGSGAAPAFCAQLAGVASQGAGLRAGAAQSAGGAGQLSGGLAQLAPGASQLASGTQQLADGMPALSGGIHDAATGAGALASSLPQLSAGARDLAGGVGRIATGAGDAAAGAGDLRGGIDSLASGTGQLRTGASDLASGLGQGVAKIPSWSATEQARMAGVAAAPVLADVSRANPVKDNGAGLAPYFMALALWVGSLATFLLLRPLSPRALASSAAAPLVALAGFLPAALLSVLQGVTLVLVLQWAVGLGAASIWGLLGLAVLAGLTFTAINQALVALLGTAGRFVAVLLTGLQLAAAGGTYPVDTAPAVFGWLHGWLPMTYAVDGLRRMIAGAPTGVGRDVGVLLVALVAAVLVTMYAARRQRTWTIRRLHPVVAA